ncbi:hypothetical protein TNCT_174781 [Trichonephila clavata]|uniref:Uncharacterized protein n=1 Tax=Trichonephila clavata TaxID=2740835 RepID=A0A8X6F1R5_TRICU|nr:hypothetical protein TNCT_174781 [Trichonephila clavata]
MAANSSFSDRSPQQSRELALGHSCGTVKQFGTLDTIPASQKEEGHSFSGTHRKASYFCRSASHTVRATLRLLRN